MIIIQKVKNANCYLTKNVKKCKTNGESSEMQIVTSSEILALEP